MARVKWVLVGVILAVGLAIVFLVPTRGRDCTGCVSRSLKSARVKTTTDDPHSVYNMATVLQETSKEPILSPLPSEVVSGVRKFVLFVGYARSGHSIIGSLLDAHPNVVIAHEFGVFTWVEENPDYTKSQLFNALFANSFHNVFESGIRSKNNKGYNLTVDSMWQGRYRDTIEVFGDKRGEKTTSYFSKDPNEFLSLFRKLQDVVTVPIYIIHCVRNPYDIISTGLLYSLKKSLKKPSLIAQMRNRSRDFDELEQVDGLFNKAELVLNLADSVHRMSQLLIKAPTRMLEIHNHELVSHPEDTVLKLCKFLDIQCSHEYVRVCASKVFPELSKTRYDLHWPPKIKKMVQDRIQKYPFLRRYSYDSEI